MPVFRVDVLFKIFLILFTRFAGNTVYHLAATLNAMANPLMAFLAMFLPCNSPRVVMGLASLGGVATSFIVATALNSPATLLGDLGGGLTVIGWVLVGALFSYVKVGPFDVSESSN